ncbi:uncharacterized protein TNCV_1057901 [Trichonephila clavipes]|nr:uncharacterized protein TNCV_1057901 [Trichonephila clavipes]
MLEKVIENWTSRLDYIRASRGSPMPEIIFKIITKMLERAPTSKDAGLTPTEERMSNISKYPGHLPDFDYYDGNPRNQGLVGVDGACIDKTLHMAPEEEV